MESKRSPKTPKPQSPTSTFGLGEKSPHDHEAYQGQFAVVHSPPQFSCYGRVEEVTAHSVIMRVPDAIETEYGPRYKIGDAKNTIAREAIISIRSLSPQAFKVAIDDQYHGPLAALCGEWVDIQEGQNAWIGRLVYVHHAIHRARLSPVLAPVRDERGMVTTDLVKGPQEFTYSAPMARVLTEEDVKGIMVAQRRQEVLRQRESDLRELDLEAKLRDMRLLKMLAGAKGQDSPKNRQETPTKKKKK